MMRRPDDRIPAAAGPFRDAGRCECADAATIGVMGLFDSLFGKDEALPSQVTFTLDQAGHTYEDGSVGLLPTSLTITPDDRRVAVIGLNGAGKTTLLKLLDGTMVNVPQKGGRKHPDQDYIHVDTRNILFICGGAFDGIERKIAQRLNTHVVGFNSVQNVRSIDKGNLMKYILPQDLKSFGLIPEIIGRLPVLTYLNPLDREALRRILVEPKNSIIKQYTKLFEMDGIKLEFAPDTFDFIVDKAVEYKLGARGLRSIVESIVMDAMFEAPTKNIDNFTVTLEYAKAQLEKSNLQ